MKKTLAPGITLLFLFCLVGCGRTETDPGRSVAVYIGDDVTKVNITHHIRGSATQWTAEDDEMDRLRKWTAELKYEIREFEDGHSPGDGDGGEVYEFVLTGGDYPAFSYVINGRKSCWLLIEGCWYTVFNPSDPPVTEPQEKTAGI